MAAATPWPFIFAAKMPGELGSSVTALLDTTPSADLTRTTAGPGFMPLGIQAFTCWGETKKRESGCCAPATSVMVAVVPARFVGTVVVAEPVPVARSAAKILTM